MLNPILHQNIQLLACNGDEVMLYVSDCQSECVMSCTVVLGEWKLHFQTQGYSSICRDWPSCDIWMSEWQSLKT